MRMKESTECIKILYNNLQLDNDSFLRNNYISVCFLIAIKSFSGLLFFNLISVSSLLRNNILW